MYQKHPVDSINTPIFWFDQLSLAVTIGDRVVRRMTGKAGTLLAIDQRGFTVDWDDWGRRTYPIDAASEIRPFIEG